MTNWRRIAASTAALVLVLVGVGSTPASATGGTGCTVATAPMVTMGVPTPFDTSTCPGGGFTTASGWLDVALNAGDTVTFQVQSPGGGNWLFYSPNTDDFNWTTNVVDAACGGGGYAFWQLTCQVTRTGVWHVRAQGAGTFTATVVPIAPQAGRVAGSCTVATAPVVPARVTQWGDQGCRSAHGILFWKVKLFAKDTLSFRLTAANGWDSNGSVRVTVWKPSTTDYTLFTTGVFLPGCDDNAYVGSPRLLRCGQVATGGAYIVGLRGAGAIQPLVTHAVTVTPKFPATVRVNRTVALPAVVTSPAGRVAATCYLQRLSGTTWKNVSKAKVSLGKCLPTVKLTTKRTVKFRIHEVGATGWASRNTVPVTVRSV